MAPVQLLVRHVSTAGAIWLICVKWCVMLYLVEYWHISGWILYVTLLHRSSLSILSQYYMHEYYNVTGKSDQIPHRLQLQKAHSLFSLNCIFLPKALGEQKWFHDSHWDLNGLFLHWRKNLPMKVFFHWSVWRDRWKGWNGGKVKWRAMGFIYCCSEERVTS